ncbi:ABC transporter ATP-binding protein [Candidatus Nomurabacteria bacterium]|nr:ABC transporter ATP-binding protein [Candidatus Nomurabacteria bacterium]
MIEARNLTKTYKNGDIETHVLKGVSFKADQGEFLAIMGRSGAGKSTFLYQLSLLDQPTTGEIILNGRHAQNMSEKEKMRFRLNTFGYVFQDYALLPDLTALENVVVPLLMQGEQIKSAERKAAKALERVGLGHRLNNLPSQMSGGEQQRASIARAIAHDPKILFADEPTANLDRESSERVMEIFKELHKAGQTIVMVTHEEEYGRMAEKIVRLDDGKIV